jgi:cyclic pyranopterin phosphate synthase
VFADDYTFLPHGELLSFEEIVRLAGIFRGHGIEKIRLTGGEPLLRKNIEELVRQLATALPGIDLTLTTNGSALKAKARALREAGLNRITVSLDALDDGIFKAMNDVDFPVAKVLEAIDAAAEAGLAPVKVNMVVKRGTNDREVLAMARRFRGTGHIVRFIEYMDVGSTNGWRMDEVVPSAEIVAMIGRDFALEPISANHPGEVAERWRYADGNGEIGVISSVTQAFCASCNRARLSTDGQLFTCLFAEQGYDLKSMIRSGRTDAEVSAAIGAIWRQRADNYSEVRTAETARERKVEMSFIGG